MEEEKKEKGFVIKDRRHFDESGDLRSEEEQTPEKQTEPRTDEPEVPHETAASAETDGSPFPEINFTSFIFSLSTTAMYHFGDFPDPVTKKGERNLPAAKQTIDILSILKAKTEGNLDEEEKQLLEKMLYELRMRYVKEITGK